MGLAMHNMLAKGGAFVDDFGALEGYVDQIELIENEFRIEKVYYISGSEQAETLWAEEYAKKGAPWSESGKFLKLQTRLQPIAAHFSRLGKLEKFEVSETPSKEKLQRMLDNSKMPQFAIVNSMSPVLGSKQAEQLGGTYGSGVVSLETLKGTCPEAEGEIAMLKQYTQGTSAPLVVLHNFPSVDSQAHAFVESRCDDEYLEEEWKGLHEEDEFDAEQFAEKLGQQRASMEATSKARRHGQDPSGSCLSVDKKLMDTPEIVTDMIQQKLWPTVYVLMAPRGASDFGNLVAEKICTSSTAGGLEDAVPTKYTMIDAMEICKSWGVPSASSDGSPNCAACGPWMTIVTIVCQTSGDWVR
ncbi:Adenylate kinase isoenzyme 1 [Durusdinium trenchii]|uniref:Adenylate kinase isoenzyme 1 n=1 Tax=Durusdinium trenchii TaxID=1381693 RepID=A0ABP0KZM7_9DINO